jgi:hypothetical protein
VQRFQKNLVALMRRRTRRRHARPWRGKLPQATRRR